LRRIDTGNSAPGRESFDVNSSIISPYISYSRPTLGSFSLTGSMNYVTYPQRYILTTEGVVENDGVNIFSTRFGYSRMLGTRISMEAGISYLQSAPQPQTIVAEDAELGIFFPLERSKFSGTGYDFSLSYTPGTRISTTVAFSRDAKASANVGALYQIQTAFGADVNYRLGASFLLGLGGTYTIREYVDSFVSPAEEVPRLQDNIGRVYGRVTYNPPKFYSVSLVLAYQNRSSDPVQYSFDSFSALLTVSLNFGRNS
jgi:hypothetical protein